MYRPGSDNYKMCQDIVPIVKVKPPKPKEIWIILNEHIILQREAREAAEKAKAKKKKRLQRKPLKPLNHDHIS